MGDRLVYDFFSRSGVFAYALACRHWLVMVLGHNAFDTVTSDDFGHVAWLWAILHTGNKIDLGGAWSLRPYYPLIPWLGVMALGYGFGAVLSRFPAQRSSYVLGLGGVLIVLFLLLRGFNSYGDPKPWQVLPNPVFTVLSFLNCHKYPPSLAYLLMTLGPALVLLGLFDRIKPKTLPILPIFGRTALFYYLLHLYVIHGLAVIVAVLTDGPVIPLLLGPWSKEMPEHYGYDLPVVYGIWLAVLALLYPLCVWFDQFKRSHSHWAWLKFF
ncbi:hypothetical protein [Methylocucumis oryzae]|uniref:hypothetical protein n=1 Tax=Methylocucumis oryzae TaxID=1632867 RepID=UPI001EF9FCE4|nr:hypothetical protein [Methylocucumis oryzae]